MSKKIFITDTILRDAHQSQAATRMRTGRYASRMRSAGQHWLLVTGVLGRRHV